MRRAARGKRLVAQFANPPDPAEIVERRWVGGAVEEGEIAESPADRRTRAGHAALRQLDCGDCGTRGKAHLHRQLRARLLMRLHRDRKSTRLNSSHVKI